MGLKFILYIYINWPGPDKIFYYTIKSFKHCLDKVTKKNNNYR